MKKKVTEKFVGSRLDVFLSENFGEIRSQVVKKIVAGQVFVNGAVAKSGRKLRVGDIVDLRSHIPKNISKQEGPKELKTKQKFSWKLIKKTKDYFVIDKPAGLIVHRAAHFSPDRICLTDLLQKKYPEIISVGEDALRPGIVHRLDKDVSGLMVVARNNDFFQNIKKQFQKRKVLKEYRVLVYGVFPRDTMKIDFMIKRSSQGNKMASVPAGSDMKFTDAKEAYSEVMVEKRFINYTLLKVRIKTGRMHQIRVHMLASGHPVVGDELYSTKKTREKNQKLGIRRVFLHSCHLGFYDAQGDFCEFESDIPEELRDILRDHIR